MDQRMIGLVGGIAGGLIGLMGAAIGTYCSIRNTNGPRERAFVIRSAVGLGGAVTVLAVAPWFAPPIVRTMVTACFGLALAPVILFLNRRQDRIRREEALGQVNEPAERGSEPR